MPLGPQVATISVVSSLLPPCSHSLRASVRTYWHWPPLVRATTTRRTCPPLLVVDERVPKQGGRVVQISRGEIGGAAYRSQSVTRSSAPLPHIVHHSLLIANTRSSLQARPHTVPVTSLS